MAGPDEGPRGEEPSAAQLDAASVATWPAREVVALGGWTLRFTDGFTRRINSVAALAFEEGDVDARIDRVEAEYARRGLPAQFQLSPASQPAVLADRLAARGYRPHAEASVWYAPLERVRSRLPAAGEVRAAARPDREWAALAMSGARSEGDGRERLGVLARVTFAQVCVAALEAGQTVAIGAGALRDGWVGINVMRTAAAHRRRGHAQRVLAAIADWSLAAGATVLYLSVERDNQAARALYAGAAFEPAHDYRYWIDDRDPRPAAPRS